MGLKTKSGSGSGSRDYNADTPIVNMTVTRSGRSVTPESSSLRKASPRRDARELKDTRSKSPKAWSSQTSGPEPPVREQVKKTSIASTLATVDSNSSDLEEEPIKNAPSQPSATSIDAESSTRTNLGKKRSFDDINVEQDDISKAPQSKHSRKRSREDSTENFLVQNRRGEGIASELVPSREGPSSTGAKAAVPTLLLSETAVQTSLPAELNGQTEDGDDASDKLVEKGSFIVRDKRNPDKDKTSEHENEEASLSKQNLDSQEDEKTAKETQSQTRSGEDVENEEEHSNRFSITNAKVELGDRDVTQGEPQKESHHDSRPEQPSLTDGKPNKVCTSCFHSVALLLTKSATPSKRLL